MAARPTPEDAHERRLEVLRLHARGLGAREIGRRLDITDATVARDLAYIRSETLVSVADFDAMFAETFERLSLYEKEAMERGAIRLAMDARMNIVKLLALARPERHEVTTTGAIQIVEVEYMPSTSRVVIGGSDYDDAIGAPAAVPAIAAAGDQ